ncbi:MAG: WYL domain-containing protein [Rhodoglobus sp.]
MRADRLVATILVMQARGRVTAAELAEELETSVATARRDLEALSAAGIPVYPQPGRNGGWQLLGGARTDLSGLTSVEARALFLLVGPAASVDPEAKSALRKLVRALPETFRADAQAAADAVLIDPAKWGEPARERSPHVDALQAAIVERLRVRLTYAAWDKDPVERLVDPLALVEKNERWYLLGAIDGAERTYRVDRITELETTDQPAVRPPEWDGSAAWERVVGEVRQQRAAAIATVVVATSAVPWLRERFGRESVETLDEDELTTTLRITAPTDTMLARGLAGWGADLLSVEPASVREELARLGAELVARMGF